MICARVFRGAYALEQRPDSVPSDGCINVQVPSNMTKEEDTKMKERNNSDAPRQVNCRNAILTVLHVLVLGVSLAAHPIFESGADRALP